MGFKDSVSKTITEALILALKQIDKLPYVRPEVDEILMDIGKVVSSKPKDVSELFDKNVPIEALDEVADRYVLQATLVASGTGLAGGLGFIGIPATITGLLASTVGLIHRISVVYGFDDLLDPDNNRMIFVGLAAAVGINLLAIPAFSAFTAGVAGGLIWFGPAAIEAVATNVASAVAAGLIEETLAPAIATDIVAQGFAEFVAEAIPIIGAVAGASVNAIFLRIWGKRIKEFFRNQNLETRKKLPAKKPRRK